MTRKAKKREIVDRYTHHESKRKNNPPVGLVTPETDPDQQKQKYSYDPRLDPYLIWSGKYERTKFEVDTVSLHVHERIDPYTILEKVMKPEQQQTMLNFFDSAENNPSLRNAIEFYKHDQNWSNRLIAGDSLLVMNSLLEKEGMEGNVQMVYIDPPYGIKYGSNFQPFVNKRNVTNGKDEDLTQEPEMIKAFRDTWELGIHSYLTYLRDRLILARRLLCNSGSIFVQISDENIHYVREILNEVFLPKNFVSQISFKTSPGDTTRYLPPCLDYIIWYAKDKQQLKYRKLFLKKEFGDQYTTSFDCIELPNGTSRALTSEEKKNVNTRPQGKIFRWGDPRRKSTSPASVFEYEFDGEVFSPGAGMGWKTDKKGLDNLKIAGRLGKNGSQLNYKRYLDDFPYTELLNVWTDTVNSFLKRTYVVETNPLIIQRCMLMSTDPGDLVLDPTCGGGSTAFVAEKWGRRWITCDTSRIAIALTKKRIMTSVFDYYRLAYPKIGINGGFCYDESQHITLKSIVNNNQAPTEILYDRPISDKTKTRITGPFTMEAVPAPTVKSIDELSEEVDQNLTSKNTISHQWQWREELYKTGIRGQNKQKIEFSRMESHPATQWLHADAETKEKSPKRAMISFGPEHAPLEQRQVENAIKEAHTLVPRPKLIVFAAMQFDPEAAKDIDELNWPGVTVLKVEINKDLLTKDLKKKRSNNESFWLMGQPDVELQRNKDKKCTVIIKGFDYYDTRDGEVKSGSSSNIAMWMLDEDYDGRSVYPQQVFFPMEGKAEGWAKLAKTLQAQIDEELIMKCHGTRSIPFEAGPNKRAAVRIIDDRGIESLKIISLE